MDFYEKCIPKFDIYRKTAKVVANRQSHCFFLLHPSVLPALQNVKLGFRNDISTSIGSEEAHNTSTSSRIFFLLVLELDYAYVK